MKPDFWGLAAGVLTVAVTIGLVLVVKHVAKIKNGNIGPELNLLTFGFLWDTIAMAMSQKNYWHRMPPALATGKAIVLGFLVVINFALMMVTIADADKLEKHRNSLSLTEVKRLRLKTTSFGVLSLSFFLLIKTFWD